jgi:hypothetical protein
VPELRGEGADLVAVFPCTICGNEVEVAGVTCGPCCNRMGGAIALHHRERELTAHFKAVSAHEVFGDPIKAQAVITALLMKLGGSTLVMFDDVNTKGSVGALVSPDGTALHLRAFPS